MREVCAIMRLWVDPKGALVDDQRLLAYVSSHGSLSEALKDGDFVLLSDTDTKGPGTRSASATNSGVSKAKSRRLVDFLED